MCARVSPEVFTGGQTLTARRWFLGIAAVVVVVGRVTQYLWQYGQLGVPEVFGQAPGIYFVLLGAVLVVLTWWWAPGFARARGWLATLLVIAAALWIWVTTVGYVHGDMVTYEIWVAPLLIALIYMKAPTGRDFEWVLVVLVSTLAVVFLAVLVAESSGLLPRPPSSTWLVSYELQNYWLPLSGTFVPEGRWMGPMGHNAMSGNAAVLMLIVGLAGRMQHWWRAVVLGTSLLVLVLTGSRGSYLGALVGIALVLIITDNFLTRRVSRAKLLLGGSFAVIAVTVLAISRNPHMTGRTYMWERYLNVWQSHQLWGTGTAGLARAGGEDIWPNAHNIWLDVLTKYGIFALLILLTLTGVVIAATLLVALNHVALPLALTGSFLIIGVAQSDIAWSHPSWLWMWVILAGGMACSWLSDTRGFQVERSGSNSDMASREA